MSGELDIEYDRTTGSPSIVARNVQNCPAAYVNVVLELGRDPEHERPAVGGLVDDADHLELVILVIGQHRWIPESAGSTTDDNATLTIR